MDRKIDPRRQRDIQQRLRLGNQSPRAEGPTTRVAAASERQNLVDEIARPLRASANRTEIAKQPSVRTEVLFYHFRMAENPAQNIVEVMGQTTGECAYRLHAVGLLQAHRMETVGTFTSGLAHNFNNILGGILGHSE